MTDENLTRLASAAHEWTSALNEIARSHVTSVGDLQLRLAEAEKNVAKILAEIKITQRSERLLKWAETGAAIASLAVAIIVGIITLNLSDKANKIQVSLADISKAQGNLAAFTSSQSSGDQLLDVLKELNKPETQTEAEQSRLLNKVEIHIDAVSSLNMDEYRLLMTSIFNQKGRVDPLKFWSHHPVCVDCTFYNRAQMLQTEIDYLGLITNKNSHYDEARLEADSALALLKKLIETDADQAQYKQLSTKLGELPASRPQTFRTTVDPRRNQPSGQN